MDTTKLAIIVDLAESLIALARTNPADLTALLRLAEGIKTVITTVNPPAQA